MNVAQGLLRNVCGCNTLYFMALGRVKWMLRKILYEVFDNGLNLHFLATPIGTPRQQVTEWLKEQKIPHRDLADESIAAKVIMKGHCQAIEANVLFHFDEKEK